jgi:3D (Asp-Asp-Asp) domain-containing protein
MNKYTLTAYTNHFQSTGKYPWDKDYGITTSGERTLEGVTIAADWRVLPKGSLVYIEGLGLRIVQDKGGAIKGNRIDVYFEDEDEAMEFGVKKNVKVKVMRIGE